MVNPLTSNPNPVTGVGGNIDEEMQQLLEQFSQPSSLEQPQQPQQQEPEVDPELFGLLEEFSTTSTNQSEDNMERVAANNAQFAQQQMMGMGQHFGGAVPQDMAMAAQAEAPEAMPQPPEEPVEEDGHTFVGGQLQSEYEFNAPEVQPSFEPRKGVPKSARPETDNANALYNKFAVREQLERKVGEGVPVSFESLDDASLSFALGRTENDLEVFREVKKQYPKSDVHMVSTTSGMIPWVKTPDSDEYRPAIDVDDIDLIKTISSLKPEELLAEGAAALATRGQSLKIRAAAMPATAAFTQATEDQIQDSRDIRDLSPEEALARAGGNAAVSATGEVLGNAVTQSVNLARAIKNVFRRGNDTDEAVAAAARQGISLAPAQLTPAGQKVLNYGAALDPEIREIRDASVKEMRTSLEKYTMEREGIVRENMSVEDLAGIVDKEEQFLRASLGNDNVTNPKLGEKIQYAIKDWREGMLGTDGVINNLYKDLKANAPEDLTFSSKPLKDLAYDLRGKQQVDLTKTSSSTELSTGVGAATDATVSRSLSLNPDLPDSVTGYLQRIDELPENISALEGEDLDLLLAARTAIGKKAGFGKMPGDISEDEKTWREVYGAFTDTIENAASADQGFVELWKQTNRKAKSAYQLEDMYAVKRALTSENPGMLPNEIFNADNSDMIDQLYSVLNPKDQANLATGFKSKINRMGPDMSSYIKNWEKSAPETLNRLLTKSEQQSYKVAGRALDRLQKSNINRFSEQMFESTDAVTKLVGKGNKEELKVLAKHLPQEYRDVLGYGMVTDILTKSADFVDGKRVINAGKFKTLLENLDVRNMMDTEFFSKDILETLEDYKKISSVLEKSNSGVSLQAAEVTAAALDPGDTVKRTANGGALGLMSPFIQIMAATKVAKSLTNPETYFGGLMLDKQIKKGFDSTNPRITMNTSLQMVDNTEKAANLLGTEEKPMLPKDFVVDYNPSYETLKVLSDIYYIDESVLGEARLRRNQSQREGTPDDSNSMEQIKESMDRQSSRRRGISAQAGEYKRSKTRGN